VCRSGAAGKFQVQSYKLHAVDLEPHGPSLIVNFHEFKLFYQPSSILKYDNKVFQLLIELIFQYFIIRRNECILGNQELCAY